MEPSTGIILSLNQVSKSFGDVKAVKNLSLDIKKGEIFGFLGPNGAGKTTTISMICHLLKRDGGNILFNRQDIEDDIRHYKKRIGYCPQDLVIWESLTCREQLQFMGDLANMGRKPAKKKALELLDTMGLMEKKDHLAKTLSGGMKRRLNLALGLVHEPEILILDEPQAGLDPQNRILIRETLRSMAGKKTIILTTHEMDEADRLAHRIGIIDRGELLIVDTPKNLKNQLGEGDILELQMNSTPDNLNLSKLFPKNWKIFYKNRHTVKTVGTEIARLLPQILRNLQDAGVSVDDVAIRKKTLEDVFISLTGRGLRS